MLDAMRNVIGEDLILGTAQRGACRRQLGDHVDAITVVLDHAREPPHLAFNSFQAVEHRRLGIRSHVIYIYTPTG